MYFISYNCTLPRLYGILPCRNLTSFEKLDFRRKLLTDGLCEVIVIGNLKKSTTNDNIVVQRK